jgi:uncharacterized protein (DUF2141 family)
MTRILGLALILALASPAVAQETASLTIRVENVEPAGGVVRLGLYDESQYRLDRGAPAASADVAATPGETTIVLKDLKPGTYAIEAFQDLNANGKMDFTWVGLPEEPFGFSRDARPRFSKPDFARVVFTVAPGANAQTIALQRGISLFGGR